MIPKFRAFHKPTNQIYMVSDIGWDMAGNIDKLMFHMSEYAKCGFVMHEVELMQWTGLVDMYSNQVWEHDIVKVSYLDEQTNQIKVAGYGVVEIGPFEIFYDDLNTEESKSFNSSGAYLNWKGEKRLFNARNYIYEVIGSRFLYPELLEGAESE